MPENFWYTVRDFVAGWVGGAAGLVIGHPLDTIKVRQQVTGSKFWATARRTVKLEGVLGLYKGFWAPFLVIGPSNAVFFGAYGACLRYLQQSTHSRLDINNPHWQQNAIYAGLFAGVPQVLVTCPSELLKTVFQTSASPESSTHPQYRNTREAIVTIYRHRGIPGLYKGVVPTLWRDVPASAVYTLFYEWVSHQNDEHKVLQQLLAGGIAGITSWVSTLPFDVVKSRIQSDDPNNPTYKGMMDCFYKSYKAEGLQVFGKGFWPIIVRAFLVNAVIFEGYEQCTALFNNYF